VNNYLHSTTIFRCAPCSRRTTPTSPPELRQRRWGFYEWIKLAYGVGITAGYAVIPGLTVGIAPQVIFHLIGDNSSGDSATEYDLMVRIAYAYTVIPKLSVGVEVLPGYSIIAIPSSLKEGTSFDNPKGFVMAFGAGAAYDVTDMFFANVGIGYQIGFQSTSIMGTSEDIKTSFLRILVGGGVKF